MSSVDRLGRSRIRGCAGPSRREVLRIGALAGLGAGLGLGDWLRLRAAFSPRPSAGDETYETPVLIPRARRFVLVWLSGGPSHLDTFDPKPAAPADIRGEFQAIATAVPGTRLAEVLPRLAQRLDRCALIRSVTSPEAEHDRATHHLITGTRITPARTHPGFGAVVSHQVSERTRTTAASTEKAATPTQAGLPPSIALGAAPIHSGGGFLTTAHDPFVVMGDPNTPNFQVRDLTPPDGLTLRRLQRRRAMVDRLDQFARLGETDHTRTRDTFAAQAYDLLTSDRARRAFALEEETDRIRDLYGRHTAGQSMLLARRLIEAGVPFVTINHPGPQQAAWDTHAGNFPAIRDTLAPTLDQGLSALLDDLEARGLLEETLVVAMGEFGRTPKINPNAGRDHHGRANSTLWAGASIPGGQIVGATDARGDAPTERPVTPDDLAATLYTLLGIAPETRLLTADGMPVKLVDQGRPLSELIG